MVIDMTKQEKDCLLRLEEKLDHIHEDVEKNAKEISKLKADINMGKGAVKALVWLGSILVILFGIFNWGNVK
jgi:cell division septal protein FtsQ